MATNYQHREWIDNKEIAVCENGSVVITDDGGEVNFNSVPQAILQLKKMINWLEEDILGERL